MDGVTVRAGHTRVGMHRSTPTGVRAASIAFMASGTDFGSLDRVQGLETQDQPRLFAVRFDMLAAWTMTRLAGMPITKIPMNAVPVSFVEIFVAAQALAVVVDVLRALREGKLGT